MGCSFLYRVYTSGYGKLSFAFIRAFFLQHFQPYGFCGGKRCQSEYARQNGSLSPISASGSYLAGMSMRLRGSYTVEAAAVMGIVLMALCILLRTALGWKEDTVGIMKLHETVEYMRYHKDLSSLSVPEYRIQVSENGKKVSGQYLGNKRTVRIEHDLYEPEEFIRMISLIVE